MFNEHEIKETNMITKHVEFLSCKKASTGPEVTMCLSTENPHWRTHKQLQISFAQLFLPSWVCNPFGASKCHLFKPQGHTQLLISASNSGLAPREVACGPNPLNQFVITSDMSASDFDLHSCRYQGLFLAKYCFSNHHLAS